MIAPAATPHPNELARQLTGRDYISFSAISSYSSCPLRYYFRYVQGLPEETVSSSLVFGRAIHEAVEAHFNSFLEGTESPSRDTLLTVFWDAWRSAAEEAAIQFPKNEDEQSIAALAERVITAFQESDLAHPEGRVTGHHVQSMTAESGESPS
jgi:putative RecB family exonuclease